MRPTINSIKHIIDVDGELLATGAVSQLNVAVAVPNVDPTTFVPGDVRVGAHVNGLFLSVFIIGASGQEIGGSINWYIAKLHEGQSAPDPNNTGVSKIRNQIFHQEKGLAGSGDGSPMAFKGVIVVPKSFRRMREGDKIVVALALNGVATSNATFCFKAIYKSFY